MAFDGEAVFIGSFNLDPRSAVINTEAGLYIESTELAKRLTDYMATGVAPDKLLPRPPRSERRDSLGDGEGRPKGALPGRARNRLSKAIGRQPVEAATDRLATLTPIAWRPTQDMRPGSKSGEYLWAGFARVFRVRALDP